MAAESSNSENLTLRSSDGKTLKISKSAAVQSVTLRNMIEENLTDDVIPIPNVNGATLTKVVAFLDVHADDQGVSAADKEKFDNDFFAGAGFAVLVELVSAANFLDIADLYGAGCQRIADMIKDRSVEWVRKTFNVENDFTRDEEERLRAENAWAFEDPALRTDDDED